jgi:hypothetical protein
LRTTTHSLHVVTSTPVGHCSVGGARRSAPRAVIERRIERAIAADVRLALSPIDRASHRHLAVDQRAIAVSIVGPHHRVVPTVVHPAQAAAELVCGIAKRQDGREARGAVARTAVGGPRRGVAGGRRRQLERVAAQRPGPRRHHARAERDDLAAAAAGDLPAHHEGHLGAAHLLAVEAQRLAGHQRAGRDLVGVAGGVAAAHLARGRGLVERGDEPLDRQRLAGHRLRQVRGQRRGHQRAVVAAAPDRAARCDRRHHHATGYK